MEKNPDRATEIYEAIRNSDIETVVQSLDELNMKNPIITKFIGTEPLSVLHYAAWQGELNMFRNISSKVKNINPRSIAGKRKGVTPMHRAAQSGHLNIIKYISACLDNINPAEDAGDTVMHWAATFGKLPIINWYIKNLKENKNPPMKAKDEFKGRPPLHNAASRGHLDVVEAICNELTDKNPSDSHNYTPLHGASITGKLPVVKFLVRFIPNVDIRTDDFYNNRTPLHNAARDGHLDVVQFLIEKGADPKLKTNTDKTAYDYAVEKEKSDVADYLKKYN